MPNRIRIRFRSLFDIGPGDPAPSLPLLTHLDALEGAEWLRTSLTTFATSVASILPGHFPGYGDEDVAFFRLQMPRSLILAKALEHHAHHRGQAAVYLRLTGITPPSQRLF
ncbi:MAG: DinB family protein [Gemmatimonadota bacterium]|nr:DinB family protein [Gemmatimonadota bacterium]